MDLHPIRKQKAEDRGRRTGNQEIRETGKTEDGGQKTEGTISLRGQIPPIRLRSGQALALGMTVKTVIFILKISLQYCKFLITERGHL